MFIDLGDEQVELERIEATEQLSAPFLIEVDVVGQLEVDFYPHLGKPCGLKIVEDDQLLRQFNGLLAGSEYLRESQAGHHYRLTLRPWTYFLDQNREMAIFQEKTAVDIITEVLQSAGVSDFRLALSRARDVRGYCVQYQESDFAFISRLMEEEGIYYFFEHTDGEHVMVLCDGPGSHKASSVSRLVYNPNSVSVFSVDSSKRASGGKNFLHSWGERLVTGGEVTVTLRDFDFTLPDAPLKANASKPQAHPWDTREVFHYPGNFANEKQDQAKQQQFGTDRSKALLEAFRAQRRIFVGTAQSSGLACGTKFNVQNHPNDRMNGQYLITATHHSITAEKYRSGIGGSEEAYNVRFEAIPADTPFQPPQVTHRPVVHGLESAIVTGPAGEEIYTDEYGRVKVQFHWDRKGQNDEKTTCWMRVSQTGGLGNLILPRVGHEVLVDFLGGDPDRPLVVGRVFNQSHMPIYKLPEHKTRALWRTKRYGDTGQYPKTKGLDTGAPGVNELRFEDKGGSEEVFLHAERDMNTRIRFDETHHVGHIQSVMIGYDRTEDVGNDETITIGHNRTETVKADEAIKIEGSQTIEVIKDRTATIRANDTISVTSKYSLEAGTSITLKCGASTIEMKPAGITIKSPQIKIEGAATTDVSAPMTTVKASGVLTLQGTLTKIN
jgi:type VI secretion system secreted protein VgrG